MEKQDHRQLGRIAAKSKTNLLHLSSFATTDVEVPLETKFWRKRRKFPLRTFGNMAHGCCTKASQAVAHLRLERLEQRRTIAITDQEIIDNYYRLTQRLYGGGDTGAYEIDALDEWRNPELTFRDTKGRPLTIDAYMRINQANIYELKKAIYLSGSHGIKICFNLPVAWQRTYQWDIAHGQPLIGDWQPGSWGGHSMASVSDYNQHGLYLNHTWNVPDGHVTWAGIAAYCDEAYLPIDSINAWKKKKLADKNIDLVNLKAEVNRISDIIIV